MVKLKDLTAKVKNVTSSILENIWFSLAISMIAVINFSLGLGMLSYILALIIIIGLIITNSKFYILPNLFFLVLGGGLTEIPNFKTFGFVLFCILAAIMIGLLVYYIIINRKNIAEKCFHNSFVYTTLGLLLIMLLSTITSVDRSKTILSSLGFAINLLVLFVGLSFIPNNDDSKKRLGLSFIFITLAIAMMTMITFFKALQDNSIKDIMFLKMLDFGWADSNHYIVMANFGALFALYLLLKDFKALPIKDKLIYVATIFICLLLNILLLARGSILGLMCSLLVGIIYLYLNKKEWRKKIIMVISFCVLACCGLVLILYFSGVLDELIKHYQSLQSPLNGREALWKVAWKHFKENWFLGTGYGTSRIFILAETNDTVYNYHNYFFQISTCGVLGIAVFIVYLLNIFRSLYKKNDAYSILVSALFTMFLVNGFIDTLFFSNKIMPLFSLCLCFLGGNVVENKPKESLC